MNNTDLDDLDSLGHMTTSISDASPNNFIVDPNITVEVRSQSLPHRNVYLKIKFINHDDKDHYLVDSISGYAFLRGVSINNTFVTKKYGIPWQNCPAAYTMLGYTYERGVKYIHVPPSGTYETTLDILTACEFLLNEPTKGNTEGYWFKYEHSGSVEVVDEQSPCYEHLHTTGVMDKPCGTRECFTGAVTLPKIELHFDLID